jgi:hypothetical protein
MAQPLSNYQFITTTKEHFFNDFEAPANNAITVTGVYKLVQENYTTETTPQSNFSSATLVTEIAEDDGTLTEQGRVLVTGDTHNFVYVSFEV